jgi:hypothetical protein
MEGLVIAASVITIITIGLQSSEFIYEKVSVITGGPKTVQNWSRFPEIYPTTSSKLKDWLNG